MSQLFYILSLKWTKRRDGLIKWWRPNDSGYAFRLEEAGQYSAEQVTAKPHYYDNRTDTKAIPCDEAEAVAIRVGQSSSPSLDDRNIDERVVEHKHMLKFRPRKRAGR